MTSAKRPNEIEKNVETEEKLTKVRKITTAMDFFAFSRSEVKSMPYRHKKFSNYFFFYEVV